MVSLPIILSVVPIVVFLILLFFKKTPLVWVSLTSLILVTLSVIFYWQIYPQYLIGSYAKGLLVALDIFFIIFGAIFFLEIMKETKIIENIGYYLKSISKDLRVQVIFLAWFFENFLEGTAGFGTPSTVVGPLLIGLGIPATAAVIIALLGNSASVVFGAAGAPIKIGFGELAGATLPLKAALFNLTGILVPVFILWFLTKGKQNAKKEFFEALPFAVWAGIAFAVPSLATVFLGQEFPSILGSVIGLVLVLVTTKLGILVPKMKENLEEKPSVVTLSIFKVLFPYAVLVILLILGKFLLGSIGIPVPLVIKHTFAIFNPGFAFLITGILTILIYKVGGKFFIDSIKHAARKSFEPFIVIAFMAIISQLMVTSVNNPAGMPSMINFLANSIKNSLLPFWAPITGAFGSFLTGSATVSNLMFGNFLANAAQDLNMNVDTILALAVVGGAAGNMIALADIMAAETVVGIKNEERSVIRGVIVPCSIYVLTVGILGLLFS